MKQKNFISRHFGKINFIEINLNVNFCRPPGGAKPPLPVKRILALVMAALAWLTNGVQAPVIARPTVEIVSPAPGSTYTAGSPVTVVARVTATSEVKTVEFYANSALHRKSHTLVQ
jgi:hypothetical protein